VFAYDLVQLGDATAARLMPLTFLVIVGTVAFYGVVTPFLARWLRVATPNPQGMLMVGAAPWVREVAKALDRKGVRVLLADSNWGNVAAARRAGLRAHYANVLTERALERLELELDGIGRILALTPNDEVNALTVIHFGDVFERAQTYQVAVKKREGKQQPDIPQHLRGRYLFRADATHEHLSARFVSGAVVKTNKLTEEFDFDGFRSLYGDSAIPLFAIGESGRVQVLTAEAPTVPKVGQTLISLVDPQE
jgi:hypothetical protein